jgi:hypothetical protein
MSTTPSTSIEPPKSSLSDSDEEIASTGNLAPLLRMWREESDLSLGVDAGLHSFDYFDRSATFWQSVHAWTVVAAAVLGGTAVVFAILTQTLKTLQTDREFPVGLEPAAALMALLAVIIGLWAAFDRKWRLMRFKAERIRHLKFDFLLRSVHGVDATLDESRNYVRSRFVWINQATYQDSHDLIKRRLQAVEPVTPCSLSIDPQLMATLRGYVDERYLMTQRKYFADEGRRRRNFDQWTRHVGPVCFFLSVLCVFAHFGIEIMSPRAESQAEKSEANTAPAGVVSETFVFLAAFFPVLSTVLRTIRSANEFGRNANRFEAVAKQLDSIQVSLNGTPTDIERLMLLERAVWLLETEQLAWMRLMHEAEWFG